MNTTNAAVGIGAVVILGRWSEGDQLDTRIVVGVFFLAVILAVLPEEVSEPLAWLILIAVLFRYAQSVLANVGVADKRKGGGNRQRRAPRRQDPRI